MMNRPYFASNCFELARDLVSVVKQRGHLANYFDVFRLCA
jgi:hypothetical protein